MGYFCVGGKQMSAEVRKRAALAKDGKLTMLEGLVPEAVLKYIRKEAVYTSTLRSRTRKSVDAGAALSAADAQALRCEMGDPRDEIVALRGEMRAMKGDTSAGCTIIPW